MAEGDWYDASEVEKTVTALSDLVGSLGYAFVEVRPNIRRNKDNLTVDVTFDIQEGPRVYVERINISGNTRTLDKVIRREFRLAEGDAFSTAKVRRSQRAPAQPRLLREGRHLGGARVGAGQDQSRGPGGRAEHRRHLLRRRLFDDVGRPGRHLDQGTQPPGQGPGAPPRPVARYLEHPDRSQLHRALLHGPAHGGGLRPLPDVERPPVGGLLQRSQPGLRVARRLGLHRALRGRPSATPCARPTSTTCSPGPRRSSS